MTAAAVPGNGSHRQVCCGRRITIAVVAVVVARLPRRHRARREAAGRCHMLGVPTATLSEPEMLPVAAWLTAAVPRAMTTGDAGQDRGGGDARKDGGHCSEFSLCELSFGVELNPLVGGREMSVG